MKHYRLFFCMLLLLFAINSFSQVKNSFEDLEILFVLYDDFENKKTKIRWKNNIKNNEKHNYWYFFYFNLVDNICLSYAVYKDFDEMDRNNPMPHFKVNKRFIKNNRDSIITSKKMQEMGYKKAYNLFKKAKHIFLIDATEIKNKKVTIKEVSFSDLDSECSGPIINIIEVKE